MYDAAVARRIVVRVIIIIIIIRRGRAQLRDTHADGISSTGDCGGDRGGGDNRDEKRHFY